LIPANPIAERQVFPPESKDIALFKNALLKTGINVTLRKPRGKDIAAACGQLRLKYEKK
jgi:23S rRNA (adenine2503-C2)-methyltransferase